MRASGTILGTVSVNPVYLRVKPPPAEAAPAAVPADRANSLAQSYPGLMAVLSRRTGNPQLAFDVLQDAIVTTLAKQQLGARVADEVFAGEVFRTAINHLRNHQRHERRIATDDGDVSTLADTAPPLPELSQRDTNRRLVRALLEQLSSPRDRQVLVRHYLDERDRDEICLELNLTAAQFARVVHRARLRLRQVAEQAGYRSADLLTILMLFALAIGG